MILNRNASNKSNIKIIGYTPFENIYAKLKGVDVGDLVIKPIGKVSKTYEMEIENNSDYSNMFIIPQYHNDTILLNLSEKLSSLGIPNYNKRYNGPLELKQFKGIIHIPYAWSNLALFEAIQLGIIYFIPSKPFLIELSKTGNFFWTHPFLEKYIHFSEWYCDENKEIFVYFDSWQDLHDKVKNLNYEYKKQKILEFAKNHENKYLSMWEKYLQ